MDARNQSLHEDSQASFVAVPPSLSLAWITATFLFTLVLFTLWSYYDASVQKEQPSMTWADCERSDKKDALDISP